MQNVVLIEWYQRTGSEGGFTNGKRLEGDPTVQRELLLYVFVSFFEEDTLSFLLRSLNILRKKGYRG